MALVALDPGHGISTPGKRSPEKFGQPQVREYACNRDIAKYLSAALTRCGIGTMLTVTDNSDPALSTRASRAKNAGCKLLLSIHANAGGGTGVEAFHMEDCDKCARLARLTKDEIVADTGQRDRGLKTKITIYKNGKPKLVDSGILKYSHARGMAATLIEVAFMDNTHDIALLRSDSFKRDVAEAICKGVCKYIGIPYVKAE